MLAKLDDVALGVFNLRSAAQGSPRSETMVQWDWLFRPVGCEGVGSHPFWEASWQN